MRSDAALPAKQLANVVSALYAQADEANWNALTGHDRSKYYARWMDDPAIGGVLQKFMTAENARSWIKDGPMKEFANAQRGSGRYARFGRHGGTGPADIAVGALGVGARVTEGSEGTKPEQCLATDAAGKAHFLTWGDETKYRHLLWAALRASVLQSITAHIVVLEQPGQRTATSTREKQQALASRCDLRLHYLTERPGAYRSHEGASGEVLAESPSLDASPDSETSEDREND